MSILDKINSVYKQNRKSDPKSAQEQRALSKLTKLAIKTYFDIDRRAIDRKLTHDSKDILRIRKYEQQRANQYLLDSAKNLGRVHSLSSDTRVKRSLEPNACKICRRLFKNKTYKLSTLLANGDNINSDKIRAVIGPVHVNCRCGPPVPTNNRLSKSEEIDMPWDVNSAKKHNKKANASWCKIANAIIKESDDEGKAIRIANSKFEKSFAIMSLDEAYEELAKSRTQGAKDKTLRHFRCPHCGSNSIHKLKSDRAIRGDRNVPIWGCRSCKEYHTRDKKSLSFDKKNPLFPMSKHFKNN